MGAPARKVADDVRSRARGLEAYVGRMDRLSARQELGQADLRRVYGGAFLSFYTYFERSVERLFVGLLTGGLELSGADALVDVRSHTVARAVLVGGRSYIDWLPLQRHTVPRAKAFFSRGKPFVEIPNADHRVMERLGVIRNAIAHESKHALRQFRRTFTDGRALPPDQLVPAGYLRGQHSVGVTRLNHHFAEAVAVFDRVCV